MCRLLHQPHWQLLRLFLPQFLQLGCRLAGVGVVLLAVTLIGAELLLGVFGSGFSDAAGPLRVLAVGQFVVLAGGPVTTVLVMVGGERAQARAGWIAVAVLVALLVGLVPAYGAMGAAIATSTALSTNKLVVALAVRVVLDGRKHGGVVPG